jgi:UDP-N-acetylmuramate dehydrogenase
VSDEGFDGLVIRILNTKYQILDTKIECGAGCQLSQIVNFARDNSLAGLEWATGIPGTVGGAIWGNAGAYGNEMKDVVESIKVLEIIEKVNTERKKIFNFQFSIFNQFKNFQFKILKNSDCQFIYRDSIFKKDKNLVIISCVLKLQKGDKIEIENRIREVLEKRTEKVPVGKSPGSFFQNPTVKNPEIVALFEKDTGAKCRDNKIPAGWLIDEVGLRGKKIGGAQVSEKHANFVINLGNATAQDVIMLTSLIKMKVRNEFGVQLKEEVQYVGF